MSKQDRLMAGMAGSVAAEKKSTASRFRTADNVLGVTGNESARPSEYVQSLPAEGEAKVGEEVPVEKSHTLESEAPARDAQPAKESTPPKKSVAKPAAEEGGDPDDEKLWTFNLRSTESVRKRLEALAKLEDRSLQYVAKRILLAGLEAAEKK